MRAEALFRFLKAEQDFEGLAWQEVERCDRNQQAVESDGVGRVQNLETVLNDNNLQTVDVAQ